MWDQKSNHSSNLMMMCLSIEKMLHMRHGMATTLTMSSSLNRLIVNGSNVKAKLPKKNSNSNTSANNAASNGLHTVMKSMSIIPTLNASGALLVKRCVRNSKRNLNVVNETRLHGIKILVANPRLMMVSRSPSRSRSTLVATIQLPRCILMGRKGPMCQETRVTYPVRIGNRLADVSIDTGGELP